MRVETTRVVGARRGFGCGAACVTGLAVFLIVSLVATALFVFAPSSNGAPAPFLQAQGGSLRWDPQQRLTILLAGTDSTSARDATINGLVVVAYDPASRSTSMLSIPANLWVTIPGFGPSPLAGAYRDGGPGMLLLMTQSVTHVAIPYYAVVGANTLREIVDAMGGITTTMTTTTEDAQGFLHQHTASHHLTGTDAMRDWNADFAAHPIAAMRIQQAILSGLVHRALGPQEFFQIPTLVNSFGGQISTNFPYDQMPGLAHALLGVPPDRYHQAILDYGSGAVSDFNEGGQRVLLPDWGRIRSIARAMIPDPVLSAGAKVEVLNGNGVAGQASSLASWLSQSGIRVRGYDSAPSFTYRYTEVMIGRAAGVSVRHVAQVISILLHVAVHVGLPQKATAPVVVIIGHDFQNANQQ